MRARPSRIEGRPACGLGDFPPIRWGISPKTASVGPPESSIALEIRVFSISWPAGAKLARGLHRSFRER